MEKDPNAGEDLKEQKRKILKRMLKSFSGADRNATKNMERKAMLKARRLKQQLRSPSAEPIFNGKYIPAGPHKNTKGIKGR